MPTKTVRAVERAIDVLDAIRYQGGTAGISEISKEVDLPKSTVHRILVALSNKFVLRKDDVDRYSFGPKMLELAFASSKQWDIVSIAMPYLEQLRDSLGETTTLGVRIGNRHSDIACALSQNWLRWTPRLGEEYPLHWGALGKAILAFLPKAERETYLADQPLDAATDRTLTDPAALASHLESVREAGYAYSFGEHEPGAAAVAAPIRNHDGFAYAAVCIQGPESRLREEDAAAIGAKVTGIAHKIQAACQLLGVDGAGQLRLPQGVAR